MAGTIRSGTIRWYIGAAVCILVILVMAAGCSMASSPNGGNTSGGNGQGATGGGNGGGGSSGSSAGGGGSDGGYGPQSQSVGSGTETWQATVSFTENDQTSTAMVDKNDPTSTETEVSSANTELHGFFPVTVQHEKDEYGINKYEISGHYPVVGTFDSTRHVESHGSLTDMGYSNPPPSQTFDEQDHGKILDTDFVVTIDVSSGITRVQLDNSFDTDSHQKQVASQKDYNYEKSSSQPGSIWEQCHSDVPNSDDTFPGGTHNFHRDGAKYVIYCHAKTSRTYPDDTTGSYASRHYDPDSLSTKDITLDVTLDPEYVQGTPQASPTSTKPEPTVELAPLEPKVSLEPLVSPKVPLAPLVPNNP